MNGEGGLKRRQYALVKNVSTVPQQNPEWHGGEVSVSMSGRSRGRWRDSLRGLFETAGLP